MFARELLGKAPRFVYGVQDAIDPGLKSDGGAPSGLRFGGSRGRLNQRPTRVATMVETS